MEEIRKLIEEKRLINKTKRSKTEMREKGGAGQGD